MKRPPLIAAVFVAAGLTACSESVAPDDAFSAEPASLAASRDACWGQATKVFAQTGEMGRHSSQQTTPRLGLRNLARSLYELGVIDEPTLQALGAFVATELGLSIDACFG